MNSIKAKGAPSQYSVINDKAVIEQLGNKKSNAGSDLYIDDATAQKFSDFLGSNNLILAVSAAPHNANNNNVA